MQSTLVGEIQADQHGLTKQISACCTDPFGPVRVELGVQGQIGPRRLVKKVSSQKGMGIDIVIVVGKAGIPLPIVANDVVSIGEEPIGNI